MGCYAQTELGHGSNVAVSLTCRRHKLIYYIQALETTSTFDKSKDEFVLNTTTINATKWWHGELGKFANHAAVAARLIIDDQDYGVQFFIVPIRDANTHEHLSGIDVGDMGPKIGYNSKDNGFLSLKNVRIPRANMVNFAV